MFKIAWALAPIVTTHLVMFLPHFAITLRPLTGLKNPGPTTPIIGETRPPIKTS
jgi:hypothetical protein